MFYSQRSLKQTSKSPYRVVSRKNITRSRRMHQPTLIITSKCLLSPIRAMIRVWKPSGIRWDSTGSHKIPAYASRRAIIHQGVVRGKHVTLSAISLHKLTEFSTFDSYFTTLRMPLKFFNHISHSPGHSFLQQ